MKITMKKLIGDLNKDLELEYAAAIQYVQHAAMLTGAQYHSVQKELVLHSTEEMQHAVTLSEQIVSLGGMPTVAVEKREVAKDSVAMLKQDLDGEKNAIRRYKERIAQAENLGEYGLRRVLEDILIIEEEHRRDILAALGR